MATKVDLPKELIATALDQAISLRHRQIKAATNNLIRTALEDEVAKITTARNTLADVK